MNRILKILCIMIGCCLAWDVAWSSEFDHIAGLAPKRILILYSYNFNFPSQHMFADGFEAAKKAAHIRSGDFIHEFLDLQSCRTAEDRAMLQRYILKKYEGQRFDLIITVYDSALDFLIRDGRDLSPKTPCLSLFAAEQTDLVSTGRKIIRIPLQCGLANTLQLSLKLLPEARNVFIITGSGKTDRQFETLARKEYALLDRKLSFEFSGNMSVDDVLKRVSSLSREWIVIYCRVTSDITGKIFIPHDVASMIAEKSSVPVFCLMASQLDSGVVGGYLVDFERVGDMLTRTILMLSAGKIPEIGATGTYIRPMFNWSQIQRWKIDTRLLPSDSFFINRPETIWNQYRRIVTGAVTLIFGLTLIIIVLLVQKRNVKLTIQLIEGRKQTEKIQLINDYNRTLIEVSLDPLVTIGPDGKITDVNHATEKATGLKREDLIGTDFAGYFTEPERAKAGYRQIFKNGKIRDYALNLRHEDGSTIPVLYNASVFRNAEGEVIGVFAAARDISVRKRIEAERVELERRLFQAKKSESLGRMAGAIAHNYNNILTAVIGNIELSLDYISGDSPAACTLKKAMNSARRAADISGLMLTYLGKSIGRYESVELGGICLNCLEKIREDLPDGIEIISDLPSEGFTINADVFQINQVLSNLITNSCEAIGEKRGAIHVSIQTVEISDIPLIRRPLGWHPKQDLFYVCLEVRDNGCGIATDAIEYLFDPFFTSKFTGRGLGLSVVLGIVRAHQGAVSVESQMEKGSVFKIFFPLSAASVPVCVEKVDKPLKKGNGSILLVEDEPDVRKITKNLLEKMEFSVLEAKDGIEALDIFRQNRESIRCVLSDLTMPRMDGWQTLVELRKISPGISVVLYSGYDRSFILEGDHTELPQAILKKPFTAAELHETILNIFEKSV